jgi:hypothetical protein
MTEPNEDIVVSRIEIMPDWKCSFCGTINPSNALSCSQCRKTREESDAHYFDLIASDNLSSAPPPSNGAQSLFRFQKASWERFYTPKFKLLAFLLVFAIGFTVWFIFKPTPTPSANYKVAEVRWERTISIERMLPVSKKSPEKRTYAPFRSVKAEGKDNSPQWPNSNLSRTADGKPDKEGRKTESYWVRLERSETSPIFPRTISITTSETEYRELFLLGKTISVSKDDQGRILAISPNSKISKVLK